MTPDPDVKPVGFAATEGPGAPAKRRRNPLWLLLSIVLAVTGLLGIGWFVKEQIDLAPDRAEAVTEGRVAALEGEGTPVVRFRGDGDYTVWLDLDEVTLSNNRETIVSATNCAAAFESGGSKRFRGARQGSSVSIGHHSTVGTFEAPAGDVELTCRQLPFGRLGRRGVLREVRSFFVTPGKPGVGWQLWVAMFAGTALLIPAGIALGRYRSGSLRPR